MKLLLENGHVIDPASGTDEKKDLLVEDGLVREIGRPGSFRNVSVEGRLDVSRKWIVPGLVDLHVHLREPGYEWKETVLSGSRAAVAGGFTTVCCMANTNPVNDTAEVTRFILEKAASAGFARVRPVGALTAGLKGEAMAPYSEMHEAGCVAFSDDGRCVMNTLLLRRALEWCSMAQIPVALHEEDPALCGGGCMNESALSSRLGLGGMPGAGEDLMVARDIELARVTNGRLHFCHVSTRRSVQLVRRAKEDGIPVTAEVTPHHLFLTEDAVLSQDTNARMSPPLRTEEDVRALRQGLSDGTIDCVSTDHAPHELDRKRVEFALSAPGIIGLQTALPLILDLVREGVLTPLRAVESMTLSAARAFNMECGTLLGGRAADITIIDPEFEWEFGRDANLSLSANSPFFGRQMKGRAESVMIGGRFVLRQGELDDGAVC